MTSPLTEIHQSLGGVAADSLEADAPAHYGDWLAEYRAACETAAIFDRSALSKIELRGRDRAKFLHNLCTNNVTKLTPGHGCETFLTNAQGKILYWARVLCDSESLSLDTIPGVAAPLLQHLDRYLITEKVELQDRSGELAQLLIVGPRAKEISEKAMRAELPELIELQHTTLSVSSYPVFLFYHTLLGLPAYEVRVEVTRAAEAWTELCNVGQSMGLRPMGTQAYEALRIEAGLPVYGREMDESNLPQEIGRTERAVSFTKGCYLGQETVARIDALGHVNRHLVGLAMPSLREPPAVGTGISRAGKAIGQTKSAVYSPALGHAIALGFVRRGNEKPGTEVVIDTADTGIAGIIQSLPMRPSQ